MTNPAADKFPTAMVENATEYEWAELPEWLQDKFRDVAELFGLWVKDEKRPSEKLTSQRGGGAIPTQAIEAAARYLSDLMADPAGNYTMEARDLLEVAAPYIAEATLEEAANSAIEHGMFSLTPADLRRRAKSYRTTK